MDKTVARSGQAATGPVTVVWQRQEGHLIRALSERAVVANPKQRSTGLSWGGSFALPPQSVFAQEMCVAEIGRPEVARTHPAIDDLDVVQDGFRVIHLP